MMVRLLMALQGAAAAQTPIAPIDYDLRRAPSVKETGAIVVTARRRSQRIDPAPPPDTEPPLGRAEMGLFGKVRANVHVASESFGNGTTSQRVMVGIKLPF